MTTSAPTFMKGFRLTGGRKGGRGAGGNREHTDGKGPMECKTMSTSSFPKRVEYALMYVIRFRWAACQLDALGKCRVPMSFGKHCNLCQRHWTTRMPEYCSTLTEKTTKML